VNDYDAPAVSAPKIPTLALLGERTTIWLVVIAISICILAAVILAVRLCSDSGTAVAAFNLIGEAFEKSF
jgi:hypothetical protein